MNMMKKMYEEGDENMKRTIAEAWTKANDKKGDKPDFSDRYDFLKKWSDLSTAAPTFQEIITRLFL